ncbi:MAG: alpha-glucosidase [Pseudomonadota bacterium]
MDKNSDSWRGAVFYQIYPRSFLDTNGDGIGDLPGVTKKLEYVASIGVDGVWLSPFFKSPMRDFGYDVSDYLDVDPIFGTLADFDRLLARAHELGLKVIIDQVLSHTSDLHPWFVESRQSRTGARADWYVWAEAKPDGTPPNNWQSIFSGPSWTWDMQRRQYYLHNFLPSQPALIVRDPEVQSALLDVCRFWLDRGVDGFRLDAVNHAMCDPELRDNPLRCETPGPAQFAKPHDFQKVVHNISHPDVIPFLEKLRRLTDQYGDRFMVAEVGGAQPLSDMLAYTEGTKRLHTAYSFDFLEAETLTPDVVRQFVAPWLKAENLASWPAWAFSNHDRPRAISRFSHNETADPKLGKLLLTLLIALRGNSFIYQGEELGLPQGHVPFDRLTDPEAISNWPVTLGRDGTRTPMPWVAKAVQGGFSDGEPWLPLDPEQVKYAVDGQGAEPKSLLHFTRALLKTRRQLPDLIDGDMQFLDEDQDPILTFRRGDVLCRFNLSAEPVESLPQTGDVLFDVNGGFGGGVAKPYAAEWRRGWR